MAQKHIFLPPWIWRVAPYRPVGLRLTLSRQWYFVTLSFSFKNERLFPYCNSEVKWSSSKHSQERSTPKLVLFLPSVLHPCSIVNYIRMTTNTVKMYLIDQAMKLSPKNVTKATLQTGLYLQAQTIWFQIILLLKYLPRTHKGKKLINNQNVRLYEVCFPSF